MDWKDTVSDSQKYDQGLSQDFESTSRCPIWAILVKKHVQSFKGDCTIYQKTQSSFIYMKMHIIFKECPRLLAMRWKCKFALIFLQTTCSSKNSWTKYLPCPDMWLSQGFGCSWGARHCAAQAPAMTFLDGCGQIKESTLVTTLSRTSFRPQPMGYLCCYLCACEYPTGLDIGACPIAPGK